MHARLRGSKSLLTLYQIIIKPDFPSLADEIAEPHPDMNIKVAAFTVSEKSSNTDLKSQELSFDLNNIRIISLVTRDAAPGTIGSHETKSSVIQ